MGHVRRVLDCLREVGLTATPRKCAWGGSRMEFLGHLIGSGEMSMPDARAKAIRDFKRPVTRYPPHQSWL